MKIMASNRGSLIDLLDAVQDRIDDLKYGGVTSCGDIQSCGDVETVTSAFDASEDYTEYMNDLQEELRNYSFDEGADSVEFDVDTNALIMYVVYGGDVYEYKIPYSDLVGDVGIDSKYIIDSIAF